MKKEKKTIKREAVKDGNPRNGAGECLYFDGKNLKDEAVEGKVLNGGFNNGFIGGKLIEG